MAISSKSSVRVPTDNGDFIYYLSYALLEWLLIFLLFLHAFFSFLLTRYARLFKLQTPCLFCTRLDHVLTNENPGFYWDLICASHKSDISSLLFCHAHCKLADVHGMCETCLLSFATDKESNSETHRLLVGKLGSHLKCSVDFDKFLSNKDDMLDSSRTKLCSCCKASWISRLNTNRLFQMNSIEPEVAELDILLPDSVEMSRLSFHDDLKKSSMIKPRALASSKMENHSIDSFSQIGYKELKFTSGSESEIQFSDKDYESLLVRSRDDLKEEVIVHSESFNSHSTHPDILLNTLPEDFPSVKMIHQTSVGQPAVLVSELQHDVDELLDLGSSASGTATGHEDLNCCQVEIKPDPSTLSELISVDDIPSSSDVGNILVKSSEKTLDFMGTSDIGVASMSEKGEICQPESGLTGSKKKDRAFISPAPLVTNLMDLSDAYKLVVGNKRNQVSNMLAEKFSLMDSTRASEDLKQLLSQLSVARGLESPLSEMSPRVHGHGEDLKTFEVCSPIGLQVLQKRISLEKNESGLESFDGSIISEIEGESLVDRLKRHVEYDRKCISALYKELEEERSASAVAANQAMAMITRLQEEKATLQMESLQYLRMMEEQAEYDVDALEKANELLAEKEKEVQDLEAELECHTKESPGKSILEITQDCAYDPKGGNMRMEQPDVPCIGDVAANNQYNSPFQNSEGSSEPEMTNTIKGNKSTRISNDSIVNFEDERLYISQCLQKLEKKLLTFSNNDVYLPNGVYSEKESNGVNHLEQLHWEEVSQGSTKMIEDVLLVQQDSSLSTERTISQWRRTSTLADPPFVGKDDCSLDCCRETSTIHRETDLVALGNEVSDLSKRLKALEADRNFLEHTINSLRSGDEGLQFIQEIAHHLQELHRIRIQGEDFT